jgi:hypothetical protein
MKDGLTYLQSSFRIGIHRIHMFLGLLDPEPLVRGIDPDPSIITHYVYYGSGQDPDP